MGHCERRRQSPWSRLMPRASLLRETLLAHGRRHAFTQGLKKHPLHDPPKVVTAAGNHPPGRVPHPGPGPARADPLPAGGPDAHRPPRRAGVPAWHQRPPGLEAAAVRIEDYADTLRGHRVLHLVGKGNKPATMPVTVPVLRVLEACRGQRVSGPLVLRPVSGKPIDRRDVYRMVARIAKPPGSRGTSARTRCGTPPSPTPSTPASPARRADPGPARRPANHRALRPRPRQPRPTRRPLPHRLRRRRLNRIGHQRRLRPVGRVRRLNDRNRGVLDQ